MVANQTFSNNFWAWFQASLLAILQLQLAKSINAIKIAVIIPTQINVTLRVANEITAMIVKQRMAIALKTIPTIKATFCRVMEPKRSTESIIKSMAKMISAGIHRCTFIHMDTMLSSQKVWKKNLKIKHFSILLIAYNWVVQSCTGQDNRSDE